MSSPTGPQKMPSVHLAMSTRQQFAPSPRGIAVLLVVPHEHSAGSQSPPPSGGRKPLLHLLRHVPRKKTQVVRRADGLDKLTNELIAVSVSAVSGCDSSAYLTRGPSTKATLIVRSRLSVQPTP